MIAANRPPDALFAYTERPVAVVSEPLEAGGFSQLVAYPSHPRGGRKVLYRTSRSMEDALKAVELLRQHAPTQAVAVLDGQVLGRGPFVVTPLGTPKTGTARNIPRPARPTSDKLPVDVSPAAHVAPATAGLRALMRTDGTLLEFPREDASGARAVG